MLQWANHCSIFLLLDSNGLADQYSRYELLMAAAPARCFSADNGDSLESVQAWQGVQRDWLFGHVAYDFKSHIDPKLISRSEPFISFPIWNFISPGVVVAVEKNADFVKIACLPGYEPDQIFSAICAYSFHEGSLPQVSFNPRLGISVYLERLQAIRRHLIIGDCYELNFCNEAFATDVSLNPLDAYAGLQRCSPNPFSFCYKYLERYALGASPERFVQTTGRQIVAQPIKGTIRRGLSPKEDQQLMNALKQSEKDRAENVMIVDLMRNDLAKVCAVGSVTVNELFGIYSFPQVHQMISTISGTLNAGVGLAEIVRHMFPMGSMTGAPKRRVMELIDQYEAAPRNLFSGTVGYIDPIGNMDFNVVIRTLFFDRSARTLSYQTGGAITVDSDPEAEWEESRLKASALEQIFDQGS